jgi:hypothetical protein
MERSRSRSRKMMPPLSQQLPRRPEHERRASAKRFQSIETRDSLKERPLVHRSFPIVWCRLLGFPAVRFRGNPESRER